MTTLKENIKKISTRLLAEGSVDMVIGYKDGSIPLMTTPWAARNAADVEQFVWNSSCCANLANYLMDTKEKVAVIAKGCDCRSIVNHISEGKVKRENVIIIGVPCTAMIDRYLTVNLLGSEIVAAAEKPDGSIVVESDSGEQTFKKDELLRSNCKVCVQRNPVIYDEMAADPVEEPTDINRFQEVEKIEALDGEARWIYFEDLVSTCIRCYACRDSCPTCYCPTCFVDESQPQWVGKSDEETDVMTFHILRAFHTAGRCTDCGACASACPMGIDMRGFTKKLEKDCLDLWDWEAGQTEDTRPALETFQPDDPEDNFK